MTRPTYRTADVDGIEVFYREAGDRSKPTILLLHGISTSSHMFRDLIPLLAGRFHLIAPDLPGFGQSALPSRQAFGFSFGNLAKVIGRFTEVIGIDSFALYVFDYGAPTGLRLALDHPERITAIVSQNGNAYEEGLSDLWDPIQRYWRDPSAANRQALRGLLTPNSIRWRYEHGVPDLSRLSPDGSGLDAWYIQRPGVEDIQLDLLLDYASNVALYPAFQAYFRQRQPRLLAIWGRKDPFLLPPGAEAFRRDLPMAEIRFLETGHFAVETHAEEIAQAIHDFLRTQPTGKPSATNQPVRVESPAQWYERMPRPTISGELTGAILRYFDGTSPTIEQPALDENIVAIHLGGNKRVNRWQGRTHRAWDVPRHAVTLMPAFRANRWHTEGVIAYAHLTLSAGLIARLSRDEFDRDPGEIVLLDKVGIVDPLISELMLALRQEIAAPGLRRLYRDSLVATLGITLLRRHSTLIDGTRSLQLDGMARGGLAGWQLRRVLDRMAAHALSDVGLDELVRITGLSRAQFFRSFQRSTGHTPARYMLQLRMQRAATLLEEGRTIHEVAHLLGYTNRSHFAAAFRRHHGTNPSEWRRIRKYTGPPR